MRLVLITENFAPLRNSGAVQLRDLAREFVRQGHNLTVILPTANQSEPWQLETYEGIELLRLKAPETKHIGYVFRTLAELVMPFAMLHNLRKSPIIETQLDGVIWYSPSIFHGFLANVLKNSSGCKGYLIIRDIFPEWAADMGLMSRGLLYQFFIGVARYQYAVANVIGVQTLSNKTYFKKWQQRPGRKLEVLQNWLDNPTKIRCSIRLDETPLSGRKVFVYAGNMGIAQGVDIFLDLANQLQNSKDIGFLFVGRGSHVAHLKTASQKYGLSNVLFYDEIHPDEIPDLYTQCCAGIVALDYKHKIHNIPGKFLTYMQNGLPVLANVNAGNDLAQMIRNECVGHVCETNQISQLLLLTKKLLNQIQTDSNLSTRCKNLFKREFTVKNAVIQIVAGLSSDEKSL